MSRPPRDEGTDPFEAMFQQIEQLLEATAETMDRMLGPYGSVNFEMDHRRATPERGRIRNASETCVDVQEDDEAIRVVADLPGVSKDTIDVRSDGRTLSITATGNHRDYTEQIRLQARVDEHAATAAYNNGILEVTLPRHDTDSTDTTIKSVLILPQRQTALVAKQAAEVDVLSGGRLRLGVGVGWNDREYEALGMDFGTRGQRIEEQIEVLRRLWIDHLVEFDGRWHSLPDAGINPRPVQHPIPIWMGGDADPVLRRVGRLADGWLPRGSAPGTSLDEVEDQLTTIRDHAREASRDPDDLRIVPRLQPDGDPSEWVEHAREWRDLGATHLAVDTIGMDLSAEEHVEMAAAFHEAMTDAALANK